MLSEVDRRVDSGEIETVYLDKKCKGKACNKEISNVPKKALNQTHKVKIRRYLYISYQIKIIIILICK
jgi:hypothetical protein